MKRLIILFVAVCIPLGAFAFTTEGSNNADSLKILSDYTVKYAVRDTGSLDMDLYLPKDSLSVHKCIIYIYGGGFVDNNLRADFTAEFCKRLSDNGFVTCAIDYRLGMRGISAKGVTGMIKPVETAIRYAAEDLFSALKYILNHAAELKIDTSTIILCGSSAGAITALQSDYELCNRTLMTSEIPEDFRFAGVISFSGAVFSREGKCDYKVHAPAPTMMLHGTADKLVPYGKIRLFNIGFFGSSELVKRFKKFNYPYYIYRFKDEGHGVASKMMTNYDDIIWFIDNMVVARHPYAVDLLFKDHDFKPNDYEHFSPDNLYNK